MSFRKLEGRFDIFVLGADSGEERRPHLPDGRATGGGGMSVDGNGGGVPRPDGRPGCITAMITIGVDDGSLGVWRCCWAILIWFKTHGYQTVAGTSVRSLLRVWNRELLTQ